MSRRRIERALGRLEEAIMTRADLERLAHLSKLAGAGEDPESREMLRREKRRRKPLQLDHMLNALEGFRSGGQRVRFTGVESLTGDQKGWVRLWPSKVLVSVYYRKDDKILAMYMKSQGREYEVTPALRKLGWQPVQHGVSVGFWRQTGVAPDKAIGIIREQIVKFMQAFGQTHEATESVRGVVVVRPEGWEAPNDEPRAWTRRGHVYRGMDETEYKATVGRRKPIQSTGKWSTSGEGTNFADNAADAEDYVNYGRTDPRATRRPTYVVEVQRSDDMKRAPDGYIKTQKPVPFSQVTRVWKLYATDGPAGDKTIRGLEGQVVAKVIYHGR